MTGRTSPYRRLTAFLGAATAAVGVTAAASAQLPAVPACPPLTAPYCPPGTVPGGPRYPAPIEPLNPGTPDTPGAGTPDAPGTAPINNQGAGGADPSAGTASNTQVASAAATRGTNMMGDLIGARSLRVGFTVPLRATFQGTVPTITASGGTAVLVNPNSPGSSLAFGPTPNGSVRTAAAPFTRTDLTYVQPTTGGGVAIDRDFARAALQSLFSTGGLTPEQVQQFNKLSPADRARLLANRGAINGTVTQATRGLGLPAVSVTSVDATLAGTTLEYTAILSGDTVVALPGSSSAVGRVKMSEDNSPLPRDRVIFNYDVFDNVPYTSNGLTVNRFQAGVEKTFLDGTWSAEARLPFASTLAATTVQGNEFTDVELGNLRLALKKLWTDSDVLNISTGVAVTLPTARDQVVLSPAGGELYRFHNQSVTVEPFVAALFTPTERFFAQAWSSVNFDTSGGRLTYNRDVFGGSGEQRIVDLPYLAVDGQVGYWVVKSDVGRLRGLAPFVELHYNYAIAQQQLFNAVNDRAVGNGLTVSGIGNTELNVTSGLLMQLGDNTNLTLGVSFPLLAAPDRTFDAQYGLRFNYLFGKSARTPLAQIGTY